MCNCIYMYVQLQVHVRAINFPCQVGCNILPEAVIKYRSFTNKGKKIGPHDRSYGYFC